MKGILFGVLHGGVPVLRAYRLLQRSERLTHGAKYLLNVEAVLNISVSYRWITLMILTVGFIRHVITPWWAFLNSEQKTALDISHRGVYIIMEGESRWIFFQLCSARCVFQAFYQIQKIKYQSTSDGAACPLWPEECFYCFDNNRQFHTKNSRLLYVTRRYEVHLAPGIQDRKTSC